MTETLVRQERDAQLEVYSESGKSFIADLNRRFAHYGYEQVKVPSTTVEEQEAAAAGNEGANSELLRTLEREENPCKLSLPKRILSRFGLSRCGIEHPSDKKRAEKPNGISKKTLKETIKENFSRRAWRTAAFGFAAMAAAAVFARHNPDAAQHFVSALDHFQLVDNVPQLHDVATSQIEPPIISRAVTDIYIGGMGDGDASNIHNALATQGEVADKVAPIHYPAEIAPISGTETFDASIEQGAEAAYNAIQAELEAGNAVDIKAYSQGTVVMHQALERIAEENGGSLPDSISGTFFASPNTPNTGLYESDIFQAVEPVLQPLGVTPDHSPLQPGTETAAMTTDVIANSANRPATTQISQAIGYAFGDGHAMPTAEAIADPSRTTTHVVDGVTIHSVKPEGIQTAALRAAQQNGFYVSEAADRLGQAVAPQGEVGGPDPGIDMNEVLRSGAAFLDDTARIHGLPNPNLEQAANGINLNTGSSNLGAELQNIIPPAPESSAPIPIEPVIPPEIPSAPPEIQTAINDVTNAVNDFVSNIPPAPAVEPPVISPAPVIEAPVLPPAPVIEPPVLPPAPVIEPPVLPPAPELPPVPPEAQQIVDQVNGAVDQFLNGLPGPQ